MIYTKNKKPWIEPIQLTAAGKPNIYFSGIAMKIRSKKEMPSTNPTLVSGINALLSPSRSIMYLFIILALQSNSNKKYLSSKTTILVYDEPQSYE